MIDGGPLGFLTWSIPLLVGSLAYDVVAGRKQGVESGAESPGMVDHSHGAGLRAVVPGEAPFRRLRSFNRRRSTVVNIWTMSQRTGSVSYQVFAAGVSLAVYALFVILCDEGSLRVGPVPDLRPERASRLTSCIPWSPAQ